MKTPGNDQSFKKILIHSHFLNTCKQELVIGEDISEEILGVVFWIFKHKLIKASPIFEATIQFLVTRLFELLRPKSGVEPCLGTEVLA